MIIVISLLTTLQVPCQRHPQGYLFLDFLSLEFLGDSFLFLPFHTLYLFFPSKSGIVVLQSSSSRQISYDNDPHGVSVWLVSYLKARV
jgi:hypothetical protein